MYTIYLTNHGYSVFESDDFNEIKTKVEKIFDDCYVMRDGEVIAGYYILSGWSYYG